LIMTFVGHIILNYDAVMAYALRINDVHPKK
jgi:hypothetical protein